MKRIILLREIKPGEKFRLVGSKDVMKHERKMIKKLGEGVYWKPGGNYWIDTYQIQNPKEFDFNTVQWSGSRRVIKIEPFEPKKIELKILKQLELWNQQ